MAGRRARLLPLLLGLLAPRPALPAESSEYVPDLLNELWSWNANLPPADRYSLPVSAYAPTASAPPYSVATVGDVRIETMDTPKENLPMEMEPLKNDVVSVFPVTSFPSPAVATHRFLLQASNIGINRLRFFVYLTEEVCTTFTNSR